jgi:hypothetical protein
MGPKRNVNKKARAKMPSPEERATTYVEYVARQKDCDHIAIVTSFAKGFKISIEGDCSSCNNNKADFG